MTRAPAARPFPWREALAFGLGVLRLPPHAVWSMTPRELALAAEGVYGRTGDSGPLSRADLASLLAAFPDTSRPQGSTEP